MRIVSLIPSATEILFALGVGDSVVGVTFECDFPPAARSKRVVSTTALPGGLSPAQIDAEVTSRVAAGEELYRLDQGALRQLDPDLIVTQDLCAVCAVDLDRVEEALDYLGCRAEVLTLDPATLPDVLASITTVGRATGTSGRAEELVGALRTRLDQIAGRAATLPRRRVAVLEWTDPPYSSGHWIPDMIHLAGGISTLGESGQRSRRVTWDELAAGRPDLVVVAPCGYRLADSVPRARELVAARRLPEGVPVWGVDADAAFVRPGPRLADGVEALAAMAHPGEFDPRPELATRIA